MDFKKGGRNIKRISEKRGQYHINIIKNTREKKKKTFEFAFFNFLNL